MNTFDYGDMTCGQHHNDARYPFTDVDGAHYTTATIEIDHMGIHASIIGNVAHAGHTLATGNKIDIYCDGILLIGVPWCKALDEGFLTFDYFGALMSQSHGSTVDAIERGWYRPPQTKVRGSDLD